jgi:FkbM family methyltransferase
MSDPLCAWTVFKNAVRPLVPPGLWQDLRLVRIRLAKRMFKPFVTKQRFGDVELSLHISDPMALAWYGRGGGLLTEIELLKKSGLQSGARVFDLGAHQGVVALQLAHHVGPDGLVVAVEANPHNAALARENCRLNEAPNVVVEHAAVASRPGWISFSRDWDGQAVGKGRAKVPAITVDELCGRYGQPHVLYIDVEGYECEVLEGAPGTLAHAPDLYIEVHAGSGLEDFNGSVEKVISLLPENAYDLYAIRPARTRDDSDYVCAFDYSLGWIRQRFYLVALKKSDAPEISLSGNGAPG